jgi:hypothetical protein
MAPETGDRVVAFDHKNGRVLFEKPSGERIAACFAWAEKGKPMDPRGEYFVWIDHTGKIDVTPLPRRGRANSRAYREGHERVFGKRAEC